jgi:hypothetical protein
MDINKKFKQTLIKTMLKLILKSNIQQKEDFYKEYSKSPLYKKLIIKLRRLENKFYIDVNSFHYYKPIENYQIFQNSPLLYLKMLKDDYETELLKLQFRTLIDIYSKFGHKSYKNVAKNYEYIVKLNEDIFNITLHTL